MKKRKKRGRKILSLVFLITGLSLTLNSQLRFTGAVIGISKFKSSSLILGIILILVSIILFATATLEERLKIKPKRIPMRIKAKKELRERHEKGIETWELKDYGFRKKLVNLLDRQKSIELKKIAYLLGRYDRVRDTGEIIRGRRGSAEFRVYKGRIKGTNTQEYFTVDTAETFDMYLGKGRYRKMPKHLDIQIKRGKRFHKKGEIAIPWQSLLGKNQDIVHYYGLTIEGMLADLYRKKKR